jgi:hypothetical protein
MLHNSGLRAVLVTPTGKLTDMKPFQRDIYVAHIIFALVIIDKILDLIVRKRTIPTERPPLVGEASVNFCG